MCNVVSPLYYLMPRKYSARIKRSATSAEPAQGAERGPFLIPLSAPAISDCLPACLHCNVSTQSSSFLCCSPSLASLFYLAQFFFHSFVLFEKSCGFVLLLLLLLSGLASWYVFIQSKMWIWDFTPHSVVLCFFSFCTGCTFHEDDFSIKCPKHEVRRKNPLN